MSRRTLTIFWTAVIVAVVLLGGEVATTERILGGARSIADVAVLTIAGIGLAASLLVAGRIVFVAAVAQRRARGR